MDVLWAPWRIDYILGDKPDTCVLCVDEDKKNDAKRLILYRSKHVFIIMNKYPYNNGHLMVVPYRHVGDITDLNPLENADLMAMTQECVKALKSVMNPQAFNIGMNMGAAAGAGIAAHLHMHIVPRWNGDNSFISVLADTRSIPEHIDVTYGNLRKYFENLGV